ncbi:HIT family protein [Paenarthrobacter ureafaciens]|uniref:HIT family protein n=1 Tax=Paenarthrobacter ureafaciens TaxID=37931 RepID=UPI002DBC9F5E|nr:HIT family protein [Paenarthrobacter ureafaciens]MEC3853149.1 HIT family protein [Paenarthrobacter ureafaciens]
MTETVKGCPLCEGNAAVSAGSAASREQIVTTEHWRVIAHRSALPGWMLIAARSHARSLSDLSASAAAELGMLLSQGTIALEKEFDAIKSYVMQFSEGMLGHLHFSLAPRTADLPEDRRGAAISAYNAKDTPLDDSARDEIAHRLRAAWPAHS